MVRAEAFSRRVSDVMTKDVITIDKDERVERVLSLMEKHRISKVPVVEHGKYVGVVTDGEIADELGALKNVGKPASALHVSGVTRKDAPTTTPDAPLEAIVELSRNGNVGLIPVLHDHVIVGIVTKADLLPLVTSTKPVRDVMKTQLYAVAPTDRVVHARRIMVDHHVERLPVLDQGNVVGMIGELDLAFGYAKFKHRVPENHQSAQLKEFLVEQVMVRNVVHANPDTTCRDAARIMHDRHVGGLPLTNGTGRIAGMVTRTDLIRTIEIPARA